MLIVVGIGAGTERSELLSLAGGNPDSLFMASSFDELQNMAFVKSVQEMSCKKGKNIFMDTYYKCKISVRATVS